MKYLSLLIIYYILSITKIPSVTYLKFVSSTKTEVNRLNANFLHFKIMFLFLNSLS